MQSYGTEHVKPNRINNLEDILYIYTLIDLWEAILNTTINIITGAKYKSIQK